MYLPKLIDIFYKKYPKKLIATFLSLNSTALINGSFVTKKRKQKYGYLNKKANKRGKNYNI